jgi:SAM-dependent methyltransferase
MDHEGMVHALEEIHRLLRPDGRLIDIHPVPDAPRIEVVKGGKIVFAEPTPSHDDEDYRQSDAAAARVVQRGLFAVERTGEFDFLTSAASYVELRAYMEEANAYEDRSVDKATAAKEGALAARVETAMKSAGSRAHVVHHERARIARLRPVRSEPQNAAR